MTRVYFGTYTRGGSEGIYRGTLDPRSGALTVDGVTTGVEHPNFLTLHPNRRVLFAALALEGRDGGPRGAVAGFAIDPETGELTPLNTQPTRGDHTCHVALNPAGSALIASDYSSGTVASYRVESDGRLSPIASFIQHHGGSVTDRQKGPHVHSAAVDATGRYVVVADLGLDKLLVYTLDPATGALTPHDPPEMDLHPGAGPRHFTFHPTQRFAYVINELDSTVTAMTWDAKRGVLSPIQTVATLPEGYEGRNYPAEVAVHPSGRWLYGSNRGHDSLAIYAIDPDTGRLTPRGHASTGGQEPRHFALHPEGTLLIACNQNSGDARVFRIDRDTGGLTPTGHTAPVPTGVCVAYV